MRLFILLYIFLLSVCKAVPASEAMELFQEEQVVIPLNQAIMLIPFDTTYWTGWPSEKNNYIHPGHWWVTGNIMILNLKPAQ